MSGPRVQYGHAGIAGLVEQRRTRSGLLVGLYSSAQQGIESDPSLPWATVCEAHGGVVCHSTLAAARGWLSHPEEWCGECQEAHP